MGARDPRASRPGADAPDWLTLGRAARYLGVAESTLRKWSDQGRVETFYTPGGHRRYRRRDLDAFLGRSGPRPRGDSPHVLVVGDDPGLRELVRGGLEAEGYAVREAGSAQEGLAAVEDRPPDLILLDARVPGADGWELLRRLEESDGPGAIPVIMFSGKLEVGSAPGARRRGPRQGVAGRPVDPTQLVESVKRLLAG